MEIRLGEGCANYLRYLKLTRSGEGVPHCHRCHEGASFPSDRMRSPGPWSLGRGGLTPACAQAICSTIASECGRVTVPIRRLQL